MTERPLSEFTALIPYLRFVVSFNDEPGLDLLAYQISFWQADG